MDKNNNNHGFINAIFVNYTTVFDALLISDLKSNGVNFDFAMGSDKNVTDLLTKKGVECKFSPNGNRCLDGYLQYPAEKNSGWTMEKFSISNRINILGEIGDEEEKSLYSRIYAYWYRYVLDKNIDLMIVKNTPHEVVEFVMYQVFKDLNKKVVVLEKTYWPGVMLLITDIYKTDCLLNSQQIDVNLDIVDKNGMIPYWTKAKRTLFGDERNEHFKRFKSFIRLTLNGISAKFGFLYGKYRTTEEIGSFNIIKKLFIFLNIAYVKKKIIHDYNSKIVPLEQIKTNKFVTFFLQCEPEKNSSPLGGKYFDQIAAIETLRRWVPDDYLIVVKEHPSQFQRWHYLEKGRHIGYYSKISKLGCILVDHKTDNKDLFKRSSLNISSSGSVGLEAWLMGYKSAYLGSPWYQIFSGIKKLRSQDDLLKSLSENAESLGIDEKLKEIKKYGFTGAISSFDIDYSIIESNIYRSSELITNAIIEYAKE